jgi:cysteine sulfinate desulfinase/cysteine desulfurase-like protein
MGVSADVADQVIRVSGGWATTAEEIENFAESWLKLYRRKHH